MLIDIFNTPSPMKWTTSQVANIISIISAAGTVGALWYAYYLERKNSKKINDLAEITKELKRQNELQAMEIRNNSLPNIGATNIWSIEPTIFVCSVLNYGKPLEVTRVLNHNEKDFSFEKIQMPFQFSKHQPLELRFSPNSPQTFSDPKRLYVEISVTTLYNRNYMIILNGTVSNGEGPMPKIEIYEDEDEESFSGLI